VLSIPTTIWGRNAVTIDMIEIMTSLHLTYNAGVEESTAAVRCPTPSPPAECKSQHDFTTVRPPTSHVDYYDDH